MEYNFVFFSVKEYTRFGICYFFGQKNKNASVGNRLGIMYIGVFANGLLVRGFLGLWVCWFWDILEQTELLTVFGIIGSPEKD